MYCCDGPYGRCASCFDRTAIASKLHGTIWPVHEAPSRFDEVTKSLQLTHRPTDYEDALRAYFGSLMRVLRCHQDVQTTDGRGMLLRYVAGYVPKFSSAFNNEWLNDAASDFAICRRILREYHPLEPEMVLQTRAL